MYDFAADPALPKPELYRELLAAADALTAGEPDAVANMANVAALICELVPELNWAGFYRLLEGELVLGPFCGQAGLHPHPARARRVRHRRRLGAKPARRRRPRLSRPHRLRRGEPLRAGRPGAARGRGDRGDRPRQPPPGRFDPDDQAGIEALAALISDRI